jgi:hypothetical protein
VGDHLADSAILAADNCSAMDKSCSGVDQVAALAWRMAHWNVVLEVREDTTDFDLVVANAVVVEEELVAGAELVDFPKEL